MLNSINTNIAAYSAQGNIGKASNSASSSISRLSSGNRITKSSDDVASLSVGTSLRTGVTTLKQALANTSQGTSLLQVADGALSQISEILQRQKAIATQANSGTLSDVERGYLNQEFQALKSQIDQISSSTTFSSVKLLDGSLAGALALGTNTNDSAGARSSATILTIAAANAQIGDKINVNGLEVTFTDQAPGTAGAAGKVTIGATATITAQNLAAFLNNSSDARVANYSFSNTAGALSASWGGGQLQGATVIQATRVTGAVATYTSGAGSIAAAGPTNGLGLDRVRAVGEVSGSLLVDGANLAVGAGAAINVTNIINNDAFVGALPDIKGTYTTGGSATFSVKVGDILYTATSANLVVGTANTLTFTGTDSTNTAAGGNFTLTIKGGAITGVTGQSDVDSITAQLNSALDGVSFLQNRDVSTFQNGEIVTLGGADIARLDGVSVNFRSDDFSKVDIQSVKIFAPANGSADAKFEVVINGETYSSAAGVGTLIGTNKPIVLQNVNDPKKVLTIMTGNTALTATGTDAIDVSTQAKADAVAKGLEKAFGLDKAGSSLNFQVGAGAADTIGVQISSVGTTSLYGSATPDITTLEGAQAASALLDKAIVTINQVRADVGALMSRLDFTAANLQTSIQNQDAARGTLLDTDVAAESTAYATSQVQLQAGIAVLAQANQLPQNLLKLIS